MQYVKMTVYFAVTFIFLFNHVEASLLSLHSKEVNNKDLINCVSRVLYKFHEHKSDLTLFDMDSNTLETQGIIKAINSMNHLRVFMKNLSAKRPKAINVAYMILADSSVTFAEHFYTLKQDKEWNPMARVYVIIQTINMPIDYVFKLLLEYHVNNAIVIDGGLNIFIHYPFANGACGKRFDGAHKLGNCLAPELPNLFPDKLTNGLQNCTFRVLATHFPPYVIDDKVNGLKLPGSEQCTLEILAKIEHFSLKYEFSNITDEFSTVNEVMEATGALGLLQNNVYDVLMGGMLLTENRARPFTYLYGQTAYLDELKIFVRAAEKLPTWKIFYIEFDSIVWVLIIVSFVTYCGICISLIRDTRPKDKCTVILKLLENLLMHDGIKLHVGPPARCVFVLWLWFTFLLNSYYMTSLTSLTTTTVTEYQVKSIEDLQKYQYRSCVSPAVQTYLTMSVKQRPTSMKQTDCHGMLSAFLVVNKGYKLYTISPLSIYETDQNKFINEEGKSSLYVFPTPLNKLLTALFFYKGFPKNDQFLKHTLTMRETGLITHCLRQLQTFNNLKDNQIRQGGLNLYTKYSYVVRLDSLLIPFAILGIGSAASSIVFALEICIRKNNNLWLQLRKQPHSFDF